MINGLKPFKLSLATALLALCSSHALAFDPNAALKQQQEQQKAQKVREEKALYERYRNKAPVTINSDGTVTIGRLQWMRCSLGQRWNEKTCLGEATEHNWDDANALPGLMNAQGGFAGYTDWRLPTLDELVSLRKCSSGTSSGVITLPSGQETFQRCADDFARPTIDTHTFPNTPSSVFWSGSPHFNGSHYAWYVNFNLGDAGYYLRSGSQHVRLVRGGQ